MTALVLGGMVNFWTLLALAVAVLWLQANAISCAALQSLRAEARVRWEALLCLDRSRLEQWAGGVGASTSGFLRWSAVLERTIWPEDPSAVLGFFEERRLVQGLDLGGGSAVLELRCREAIRCYAEAAARYNGWLPVRWGWPLASLLGFSPVQEPPFEGAPD